VVAANYSEGKDDEEDEAPTGWLHNTKPKAYLITSEYNPDSNTNESSPTTTTKQQRKTFNQKMKDYRNHRIINPPSIHPCGNDKKRMMVTEHKVAVPLYHPDLESAAINGEPSDSIAVLDRSSSDDNESSFESDRETIDVYFTITELLSNTADEEFAASLADLTLSPRERAELYLQRGGGGGSDADDNAAEMIDASRMILYLQGGPGFGCAAPVSGLSLASSKSSWASSALFGDVTNLDGKTFERVVLMDQRGTGRSSPIGKRRLKKLFPDMFLSDDDDENDTMRVERAVGEATEYLAKFRADSIVRDAEWIKDALVAGSSSTEDDDGDDTSPPHPQPWGAALGQSFGGFCLMAYLSSIAHPPKMCLFTGGIAPMNTPVREVYDRLWKRVEERNRMYYERYPGDVALVKRIARLLEDESRGEPVRLPSGGILTTRRFLQLGLGLGGTPGVAFANLHSIVSSAFLDDDDDELSAAFLKRIDYEQSFDDAPLYFLLHESIYADGPASGATEWAAYTSNQLSSTSQFDYLLTSKDDDAPVLFYGEMVFPWMAEGDFAELSGNGMRMLSQTLAKKGDWASLYDATNMRAALLGSGNGEGVKSKAASATYYGDMYVDFDCAMKLVQRGGPLEGVKVWVTNEYQHSGLRDDGAAIVCKLVSMAKGSIHVPS